MKMMIGKHLKSEDDRLAAAELIAKNELAAGLRIADDVFTLSLSISNAARRAFAAR